jgi:alpha-amylase/alpha-mannosidase (GH57 family)
MTDLPRTSSPSSNPPKLHLAFLWHQHQPYYKNNGSYLMPWMRFHGTKDYYDMVRILDDFPAIRQNVNLVPSLLIQLEDYVTNGAEDRVLTLSKKPASKLTNEEKKEILHTFFLNTFDRMVKPYPRYMELFQKRGGGQYHPRKFKEIAAQWTDQDWLDLQVWYNLVWVGEYSKYDPPFKAILEKGKKFTENEKKILLDGHLAILKKIIPKHKEVMQRGQIEVSITPLYHPILPLLCDTDIAKVALPAMTLPAKRFVHPEDAELQIQRAVEYYKDVFGVKPTGMWPSEGSVSEEVVTLMAKYGIQWTATDEEVLFNSLPQKEHTALYRPYSFHTQHGAVKMVFRDHTLSDLIGFVYAGWGPDDAANDFVQRLHKIRDGLLKTGGEQALDHALVSVILDGENCWEHYESDGKNFLRTLYWLLSKDNLIQTTTIGDFVSHRRTPNDTEERCKRLTKVFPGSWINANFKIWIGHEEDNKAWDLLTTTRDFLMQEEKRKKHNASVIQQAWEEIYIADGSDWCWWFGDEHSTPQADEFDLLFRYHLRRVYQLLDAAVPAVLQRPIRRKFGKFIAYPPTHQVTPIIDGKRTRQIEWDGAGYFDTLSGGSAMHQVSRCIQRISYCYNATTLFIRLDSAEPLTEQHNLSIRFSEPRDVRIEFFRDGLVVRRGGGTWTRGSIYSFAYALDEIFELGISLDAIGAAMNDFVAFDVALQFEGKDLESWPKDDVIRFQIKSERESKDKEGGENKSKDKRKRI